MNSRVNIISINYNSAEDMLHCIASLQNASYPNYQLFIVDNQSTDDSVKVIIEECKAKGISIIETTPNELQNGYDSLDTNAIYLIKNNENKGFAAGNNTGLKFLIQHRPDELVVLLNPDIEIEPDVIQDLVSLHNGREKLILGNLIHYYNERDKVMYYGGFQVKKWIHGIKNITEKENSDHIDAITGAALFTEVKTFIELGLLPEEYFLYWEETDFCTLAKQKGYKIDVNAKSKIFDKVGSSSNSNFTREYLYLLNGLRYYKKYYSLRLPIILLSTFAKLVKATLFDSKVKQRAIYFGHIDFFKLCLGSSIDIKSRLKRQ